MKTSLDIMQPGEARQVVVFRNEAMCANWPFVGGLWRWDDGEMAVSFSTGACSYRVTGETGHERIESHGEQRLARSFDDGETWPADAVEVLYAKPDVHRSLAFGDGSPEPLSLDYTDPDAILRCHYVSDGIDARDARVSFVFGSPDRGRTWPQGPVRLKAPHLGGIQGLSSYVIRQDGLALLFVEGWLKSRQSKDWRCHVFASDDGGVWWYYYNALPCDEEEGYVYCHPGPVLLANGRILCTQRKQYTGTVRCSHTVLCESEDGGRNWRVLGRLNDYGATAHLLRLHDGRIVCTYERRMPPFGIRARVSEDDLGHAWGPEIVLRDDGGSWDLGYSRSCLRGDGSIMTFYYFNTADDPVQLHGGVRHIAATVWKP